MSSAIVVATALIGGYALWGAYRSARGELPESRCDGHERFDRARWMDTTLARGMLAIRGCMVDDLLERHQLEGMSRAEVIRLIGPPDTSDLFPEFDLVYWLGPERGLIGIDSEFLVVKLDTAKRVTSVELRTS